MEPEAVSAPIFSPEQLILESYSPREVHIVGFTGQAGAGKTAFSREVRMRAEQLGVPCEVVSFDWFFKMSSRARKAWIEEGRKVGSEEYKRRCDQRSWWDFKQAKEVLQKLKAGQPISLRQVYNREDRGELTLDVNIAPDSEKGLLVILEGVPICHFGDQLIEKIIYFHASARVRFARLLKRDSYRSKGEAIDRFRLTTDFETEYFTMLWGQISLFVDTAVETPTLIKEPDPVDALRDAEFF